MSWIGDFTVESAGTQSDFSLKKLSLRRRVVAARHLIVTLIALGSFSIDTHAQTGWEYLDETPERIIGLLDLPDIIQGGCGAAPKRATARVFDAPSQNGPSVATIYWYEQLDDRECGLMIERNGGVKEKVPTLESGYEIPAAIVFERRGSWFRIRLPQGSGWIVRKDPSDFLSYPEMLREHLAHTLQGWDGTLRAAPGASSALTPLTSGWRDLLDRSLSIQVLASRRIGNEVWLHIRLAAKAGCDQIYPGVTDVDGWIPAYRKNRTPNVWFSSRGC